MVTSIHNITYKNQTLKRWPNSWTLGPGTHVTTNTASIGFGTSQQVTVTVITPEGKTIQFEGSGGRASKKALLLAAQIEADAR